MNFDINKSVIMKTVFACKTSGDLESAKTLLDIVGKYSYDVADLDEIAYLQNEIKDYEGSVKNLKKCLSVATSPEQMYSIRANMAKIYNHLNDPDNSLIQSNANVEMLEDNQIDFNTQMEIAFSHYLKGEYTTSEKMMRELITIDDIPDNIKGRIQYNLGSYDLEAGKFKEGMKGFIEVGHKINIWTHKEIEGVEWWNGEQVEGKQVIVSGEGGIGDEIINVRFMNNIKKMGMEPIWVTGHSQLVEPFNRNGYKTVTNINDIEERENTFQVMAMFLPIVLDLDKNELWDGAYIKPSQEFIDKWSKILPEGRKLGVKWSGNPAYDQDLHRSLPLSFIENLEFKGTKINLQLEEEFNQDWLFNCGDKIENLEDTLAIIWLCDKVVTSCTSIAHMVGSMGVDGIVCPPIASYYVWLGDSKWYDDNLSVYRQTKHKDWDDVYSKVQKELFG